MDCAGCSLPTEAVRLDAIYGGQVEIDVCANCNGLWFDGRESLQLSPGATLQLFTSMSARTASARATLQARKPCPRCQATLLETVDQQRGTRFSYFRCQVHGRFITFFQFLREKNLVRAPTPKELAELRARVQQVKCSNCGGPIALAERSDCSHCGAPVSILSGDSLEKTLVELHEREVKRTTVDPTLPARLMADRLKVEGLYRQLDSQDRSRGVWGDSAVEAGGDLVELGVRALVGAVKGLLD